MDKNKLEVMSRVLLFFSFGCQLIHASTQACSQPLGMLTGQVQEWQVSVSSMRNPIGYPGCHPKYARLFELPGRAWCAANNVQGEWIQLDLGVIARVTGLMTQGRSDGAEWVTSYTVTHSADAVAWRYCLDARGNKKVFKGNNDSHSMKLNYLDHPIEARFLRIHIQEWHGHPSMRVEPVGCQQCHDVISMPPSSRMMASSWREWHHQGSCAPDDAHLFSKGGWCAAKNNEQQWLQVDLGPPTRVTGIITKGRGDTKRKQWVSAYTLSYSNDSRVWSEYREDNHREPKVFGGNMDKDTERRHYLNRPFIARFIRLHPTRWKRRISMRMGVIGCRHEGDCGPGFLRITPDAECTENFAYKKHTWVNDKRIQFTEWTIGHSSYAVDGELATTAEECAVLDNYYVEQPVWMVDLGERKPIRGITLQTWLDADSRFGRHSRNLDKLTAFIADKPHLTAIPAGTKCASVTRQSGGLQKKSIHFQCPDTMEGRYAYIKASGVTKRHRSSDSSRIFTAFLCEVMVF